MNYYLFIPFVIILILFFPIKIEGKVSFNALDFSGALGIFFYKIKLTHQQFWLKGKKIIIKKYDEIETKEIDFESEEIIFLEEFTKQLKDKTRLKELSVYYNLGFEDAMLSALLAGHINMILTLLYTGIKNKRPTASLSINDTVSYNRKVCQFAIKMVVTISLFDVLYSLLNSVVLSKKKHEKLKQQKERLEERSKVKA